MTSKWRKLGRLYSPPIAGRHPLLASHAANPLPILMSGDVYRVFFSGRDHANRSSVGAVDIDIEKRLVVQQHDAPFFTYGPENSFYAAGVSVGNSYVADGIRYMLFMGWQRPDGAHWRGDIGRLVVKDDFTLALDGEMPYLARDAVDPISTSYPWVNGSATNGYRMWYGSTVTWNAGNGEMLHVINHATSADGQRWIREGLAIPYVRGVAQAFSRPTVIGCADTGYEMWFSYRGDAQSKYRIGYARSGDGRSWELRLADSNINVSSAGWDSEMIEYPYVLDHKGDRYMLYNGNGYGQTGFGLAVME